MGRQLQGPSMIRDVAMDLGTTWVQVAVSGKGVLLREPSVAAVDRQTGQVVQVGEEARQMLGRTPGQLVAIRPIRAGVLSDYTVASAMIQAFLKKALGGRWVKPRLLIGVPSGISEVEERAVVEAGLEAGARRVYLMEAPLAALAGAGADPAQPQGRMVVDLGGGTSDGAVLALNGVVASACLHTGGDDFDDALIQYVRQKHALLLGLRTAEEVKEAIGQAGEGASQNEAFSVKGRCLNTGLPRDISLSSAETMEAFLPVTNQILSAVQSILERTPPELAADVAQNGILLTGGGSRLRGLDKRIAEATGIWAMTAQEPESCVILGLEKTLPHLSKRQDGPIGFARRRQLGAV